MSLFKVPTKLPSSLGLTAVKKMATKSTVRGVEVQTQTNKIIVDGIEMPRVVKCIRPHCSTEADHPQSIIHLFYRDGVLTNLCRWCALQEDMARRQAKATGMDVKNYMIIDLKIGGLAKPKEYQLSKTSREAIRKKEYVYYPPCLIFISDGERIWELKNFRYNQLQVMDWDQFLIRYPDWEMLA